MSSLTLRNINKSYTHLQVIFDVNLDIEQGEFVVFVGPSGCGKSTLLRMISGLESISGGTLKIGDTEMNNVPASKRGIAMVFQSYALYPHMSVFENMAFSLRIAKVKNAEVTDQITKVAKILQLEDYLHRFPKELSGGQRQRVAIGRAIVRKPKVFLFDEPLSNLDSELRVRTRIEIAKLKESMPDTTMIYVTHDQVEAMTLADKIVVLRGGRVEQVGAPLNLYRRPQNKFVAGFIGSPKMNFINATVSKNKISSHGAQSIAGTYPDGPVTVGIRPEHLQITDAQNGFFSATIDMVEHLGEYGLIYANTPDDTEIIMKVDTLGNEKSGDLLHFTAAPKNLHLFDAVTECRLADKI